MRESNIEFTFKENFKVLKFDETDFYRTYAAGIIGGKGVDFIAFSDEEIVFVEVKNCIGHETENRDRTIAGSERSFDVEVSQKINCTLSCLLGSKTFDCYNQPPTFCSEISEAFEHIVNLNCNLVVILFLEGDFATKTRSKKMIMENHQRRLKSYFKGWLNVPIVKVIDSSISNKYFDTSIL